MAAWDKEQLIQLGASEEIAPALAILFTENEVSSDAVRFTLAVLNQPEEETSDSDE